MGEGAVCMKEYSCHDPSTGATHDQYLLQNQCGASAATVASTFDMSTPDSSPFAKASSPPIYDMDDLNLPETVAPRLSLSETFDIRTPPDGEQDHFIGSPEGSEGSHSRHDESLDPWSACSDWASLNMESSNCDEMSRPMPSDGKIEAHQTSRLQQHDEIHEESNLNVERSPYPSLISAVSVTVTPEAQPANALRHWEGLKEVQLAEQARNEAAAKMSRRQNGENELLDWSKRRAADIRKRHVANLASQQEAAVAMDTPFANPWERVMELIDSTAQPAVERGRDTSRMLALLIQLKHSPVLST